MNNNTNMFPEEPENQNGSNQDDNFDALDENGDIDFGDSLEDFENLVGTDEDEEAEDEGDEDEDGEDGESEGGDGESEDGGDAGESTGEGIAAGEEKIERPKLAFDNKSVRGIAKGFKDWGVGNWRALTKKGKFFAVSSVAALFLLIIILVVALNTRPFVEAFWVIDEVEAAEIMEVLDENRIRYELREHNGGIAIDVREADKTRATGAILQAGFRDTGIAFDWDIGGGLFETQADKTARFTATLARQLMATFNAMDGIRDSQVFLVIHDNSDNILIRQQQPSTASITLFLRPGMELSEATIQGMENMVADSVPGLDRENITITDGNFNQLNRPVEDDATGDIAAHMSMIEIKNAYERNLERRLEENATRVLGSFFPDVEVTVTVNTNFDRLISETVRYIGANIDEDTGEMRGIVSAEAIDRMLSSTSSEEVWGVIGTEGNVDATGYYESPLENELARFADNLHLTREMLVGSIIEQIERTTPEITSIRVSATADGAELEEDELEPFIMLLANATGVNELVVANMDPYEEFDVEMLRPYVSLRVAPFWREAFEEFPFPEPPPGIFGFTPFEFWLGVGVFIILLIMFAVLLAVLARRSKRIREEEEEDMLAELAAMPMMGEIGRESDRLDGSDIDRDIGEMDDFALAVGRAAVGEEMSGAMPIELREENLKKQIKLFVDQNPDIAAQLIKTLLKGDEK